MSGLHLGLPALGPRDRRALRVASVVAVPALAWIFIVAPFRDAVHDRQARLEAESDLLARERSLVSRAVASRGEFAAEAARLQALLPELLGSGDAGLATAELARRVRELAGDARVHVARITPEARHEETDSGALGRVSLRVEGESDLEGLLTLLAALESADGPLLTVGSLEAGVRSTQGADAPDFETLSFGFTVTGLRLSSAGGDVAASPNGDVAAPPTPEDA